MSEEIVIKVNNVSKDFILPHAQKNTLKSYFTSTFDFSTKKHKKNMHHALKNISFEIKKGEFFGIVGRNGSGKSTLLKILAGIYQPSNGSVDVKGRLVPFIELGVGFNPELTGRENVYLNGALLNFSKEEIDKMYDEIVKFAELEKFMDQKLKNYSSGMQVRLAFSMAIRAQADILLVDEVLAVGDADFQRKCYEYFRKIKGDGTTVVFVTHDMSAVRKYCDKVLLIEDSNMAKIGNADTVAKAYLQLFTNTEEITNSIESKKRWGDKKITYKKVNAKPDYDKKIIRISFEIEAYTDVLDPNYGFKISNDMGQSILGTNTEIEEIKVGPLQKGDKLLFKWDVPNIFNEGKYYVEVAILYNSTKVSDWWEEADAFHIRNHKKTPYIVNPEVVFSKLHEKVI